MKKFNVEYRGMKYETDSSEAARRTFYAVAHFFVESDGPLVYYAVNSKGQKVVMDSRGLTDETLSKFE